jgi:hypothetical protein
VDDLAATSPYRTDAAAADELPLILLIEATDLNRLDQPALVWMLTIIVYDNDLEYE